MNNENGMHPDSKQATNLIDEASPIKKGTLIIAKEKETIPMWATVASSLAEARLEYSMELGPLLYLGYKKVLNDFFRVYDTRHFFLLAEKIYYIDVVITPKAWWTPEEWVSVSFLCLKTD